MNQSTARMIIPGIRYPAIDALYDQRVEGREAWKARQTAAPIPAAVEDLSVADMCDTQQRRTDAVRAAIVEYVTRTPGCTLSGAVAAIDHHYENDCNAAHQIKGWLRNHTIAGVEYRNDGRLWLVGLGQ